MRKVLSFVLVLALVLSSFSMAFAADATAAGLTDIAGNANEDAIQVSYDLGIVTGNPDGTFLPEKAVTRAEFAAMITRAMAIPDSALAGYAKTNFKDTAGYSWAVPYLAFCSSKGIMLGDGAGNVMPGRTITVNEAMTMALRAIGYTSNSAELVGVWPSNYVTLAQNLSLYDDVTAASTVNKASAAQIIYNVLDESLVTVDADGKTEEILKNNDTQSLLTTGLGCEKDNGGYEYVFTKSDADTAKINANKYIGAMVKTYSDDGDVVAVALSDCTFLTGSFDTDDEEFDVNGTIYNLDNNDIDYTATANDGDETDNSTPAALTNGKADSYSVTGGAIDGDTVTLAAKVSGKTIKEVYSVNTWDAEEAFQYETDMLDGSELNGYNFVEDDNNDIDVNSFTLSGVASVDKIAADAVVEVFLATPGDADSDIVKVTVGTEKVTGRVTLADDPDYTIGGKELSRSEDSFSDSLDNLANGSLGDKGTAYLNFDGDIALWEVENADSDNYAVVSDTLATVGRDHTIVLVDKTGTEKEYTLTDDVYTDTDNAFETEAGGRATVAALAVGDLVTFSVDKSGDIDSMTSMGYTSSNVSNEVNKGRTLFGTDKLDGGVIVFTYDDTTLAASDYAVIALADVETEKALTGSYAYKDGSSIAVLLIKDTYTGAESKYAVLNSSKESYDADDEKVDLVKGFVAGSAYTAYTADRDTVLNGISDFTGIYKLTIDANGVITDAEVTTGESMNPIKGYVYDKDGNYLIQVDTDDTATTIDAVNATWYTIDPNAVVYKYDDDETDVWAAGKLSDIKKDTASVDGSRVFFYQMDEDSEVIDFIVIDVTDTPAYAF